MKIGDWVVYYDGSKPPEVGKVKSFPTENRDNAFVVYHCDEEWDKFKDYTGACSDIKCLTVITNDLCQQAIEGGGE